MICENIQHFHARLIRNVITPLLYLQEKKVDVVLHTLKHCMQFTPATFIHKKCLFYAHIRRFLCRERGKNVSENKLACEARKFN